MKVAKAWSQANENSIRFFKKDYSFSNKGKKPKRLKIGYLSNDIRDHPIAHQIIDLFKYHDRKCFEVFTYSYGVDDQSFWRKEIEKNSEHFLDLNPLEHPKIAERIYQDKINILVDLVGNTGHQRPDIMPHRAAPVQISYLGYPGTTGASYIDYLIADKIVVPHPEEKYYSEKIIYMPNCYQICSPPKKVNIDSNRKDYGLPEKGVVFACFNRQEKITQDVFDVWIKILKKVPGSVLWLSSNSPLAEKNLKKYFSASSLKPERLIFAKRVPYLEHLARAHFADLALDTQIYSGGATTTNMLWSGVPVITVHGRHYLSRMSTSIIKNLGLDELVTLNLSAYENLAVDLALHPEKRLIIKMKIKENIKTFPLFKPELFTHHLEKGYQLVWNDYLHHIKTKIII